MFDPRHHCVSTAPRMFTMLFTLKYKHLVDLDSFVRIWGYCDHNCDFFSSFEV